MKSPTLEGMIERRLLLNYRVDPEIAANLLPAPFRPQLQNGFAVAGICLLRLGAIRPAGFPRVLGQRSENVAHRIAVEWDQGGEILRGVFINRRDSDSWLNVALGGRFFPGVHHKAAFSVVEQANELAVTVLSDDQLCRVEVSARVSERLDRSELFADLADGSRFFEHGVLGFSPTASGAVEAMELSTLAWKVEPLIVDRVASNFFDDDRRFPRGSVQFDSGLVMRHVPVRWLGVSRSRLGELNLCA